MVSKEILRTDLKESMKARDEAKTSTLRMLLSAISGKETEKRSALAKHRPDLAEEELVSQSRLTDQETQDAVSFEVKKRREAIQGFEKGGNAEMAEKERKEMDILMSYLPQQLTEEEIRPMVQDAIAQSGAASQKDMGKVMSILTPQTKGRADGALVSKIVKEYLGA